MSQQVQIDYEQIAVQCNSICEVAERKLAELDELLEKAESTSTSLLNEQTESLLSAIRKERDNLMRQIADVRTKAEEEAKNGKVTTNNHDQRYAHREDTINAAKALQHTVNILSAEKLVAFEALLQRLLQEDLSEHARRLDAEAEGKIYIDSKTQQFLASIEDETLRQFAFIALLQNPELSGDALIAEAKELLKETFESREEKERAKIRAELEAARIDKDIVDRIVATDTGSAQDTIQTMHEQANAEIVGEKVRQKSLKIIMQAIQARGFIVDKKNIKIKRDTNEVVLVALKASGEKAEFRVFLDGKFIYDFHGYEGQACQKDITPFLNDLEEVYGVKIKRTQEIWSNPDKNSTMKYQAINTNKNKK